MADALVSYLPFVSEYWLHIATVIVGFALFRVLKNALVTTTTKNSKKTRVGCQLDSYDLSLISEDLSEHDLVAAQDASNGEDNSPQILYKSVQYTAEETVSRAAKFYSAINRRRTLRHFSARPVPLAAIHSVIKAAGTAPSGAHMQPWTFVVVQDADMKSQIRAIVEAEEEINYRQRMGDRWVHDLKDLNVNWVKPYLEIAPYLILVFEQVHGVTKDGLKQTHYYSRISVSIACGILLAALQEAGLCTVTSTPLNAGPAIRRLVQRPTNEKLMLLLPVGYPAEDATVPNLTRKALDEIMILI
ncbi:iodotyrosine deiodinase-like [Ptychodera flava]|uniref:iodotyrosine deiodinase-like n=1 Tax=Ptychodera flava TaxID=63121 RepID=UPI00396A7086